MADAEKVKTGVPVGMSPEGRWYPMLLGALYLCMAATHLAWDSHAHRMPTFDQAAHLSKGIAFAQAIAAGHFLQEFWSAPAAYPPAFQVMLGIGALLAGPSPALGLYVNLVVLAGLIAATYRLGAQLSSPRVGFIAAVLLVLYPGTAIYTREALQEPLLAAVTVVSLSVLVSTKFFRDRRASMLLGLALGLGFLVKPTFGLYVVGPVVITAIAALRSLSRSTLVNLAIAGGLTVGIAALWYAPHRDGVLLLMAMNRGDAVLFGNPTRAWEGFLLFRRSTALGLTTFLGQYVGLCALGVAAATGARRFWVPITSILGTWLILVFAVAFRDDKYLLPTLPALAILVAAWVDSLRPKLLRSAALVVLAGLHSIAFLYAEFDWPKNVAAWGLIATVSPYAGMGGAEPSLPAIVASLGASQASRTMRVAVVPNVLRLNANTLHWEAHRAGSPVAFEHISFSGYHSASGALQHAKKLDWVLLKTGYQGVPVSVDLAETLNREVRGAPDAFELIQTFPMADGSRAEVYRVVAPGVELALAEQIEALVARADPAFRNLTFGDRFRMLAVTAERTAQGAVLRIAWEALATTPLDRIVAMHLVNDQGAILSGADYPQDPRAASVARGARWIDEVVVRKLQLHGVTGFGVSLYHLTQPALPINRGPRDWNGVRLRIPLATASAP